ncbi:MAG: ribonuclease J [Ileibacterium sp.]|nr:ribonuclease J [Ileibacterium sp.]
MEQTNKETVRIFALGGLDEDGKNMTCIEVNGDLYICETGIKFPDANQALGVEEIAPDFSYILEHKDRLKGILITHGHDDVMGALPYLLKQIKTDVYATPFTSLVISKVLKKNRISGVKIKTVKAGDTRRIGGRNVTFIPLTHSYPQAYGFGLKTANGYIVYSGEFIEDYDDLEDAYRSNYSVLNKFANDGVFILMQDSKGADRNGHTSPLHRVSPNFNRVLNENEHRRIFVEIYTQSVYRIQEIISCCVEHRRKMCFYTKEIQELVAGLESITPAVPMDLVVSNKQIDELDDVVVIISGQGRSLFRLMSNIANNEVEDVSFNKNDIIVAATPIIPGVEKAFKAMENDIYKKEGTIIRIDKNVVGMHPAKEDLKMMIYMTRPKYYIPIKGEYRMLCANAMIAEEMGIDPENIIILDNGQVATFEDGQFKDCEEIIELHDSLIDGKENWDMAGVVLKDREILSTDGVMVLAVGVDAKTKKITNGPDIQTRGLIYLKDAEYLTKDVAKIMEDTVNEMVEKKTYENLECRALIRERVAKYIFKATAKRPMVLPVVLEIFEK